MIVQQLRARAPASLRQLRLATGLILFTFITAHLLDHASGILSVAAMEQGAVIVASVLYLWPVTWILYTALGIHYSLALWAIYSRRRLLAIPLAEAAQLILGLLIIPLLAGHVIATRLAGELYAVYYSHTYVLIGIGVLAPDLGLRQACALIVAWGHGSIGLYFWLRLKPWWPRAQPLLFALALLVPTLALCGFYAGVREVAQRAQQDGWIAQQLIELKAPVAAARAHLGAIENQILAVWAIGVAVALAARQLRRIVARRRGLVRITFPGGRVLEVAPGTSVLEASRFGGIPHASVCGGRGRCSTCRVRVSHGLAEQLPAAPAEDAVLARVGAAPNVRLACQLRPRADICVVPLLPSTATTRDARTRAESRNAQGQEREIAILFADLRGFTRISEHKLPYDVVFVLNRYFEAMGRAIEEAGGHVDKFIGDGVMALFGTTGDIRLGARQALDAARRMSRNLAELNATLVHDLETPLKLGIGIHVGPAIVGEMGYGRTVSLTAIGDSVNTASRIEALTKDFAAELVVSDSAAAAAGLDRSRWRQEITAIRGRDTMVEVIVIPSAADLAEPSG